MSAPAPAPVNLGNDVKLTAEEAPKVKPCCVCKDEKASRDECMLFSKSDNAEKDCQSLVDKYRSCMAGYGFKLP
ncbi:cytochrome c oxidase copper chaperone protein [Xylona heveae TC161]|uniref:Cytochrome c oxidase copper chaperone protein n=1 Tax=Xylona heveae (strain CBS 132557 / TC161) TaxID=1328760 RepID=A0A165HMD1_XYLHT|nr:cytochrome c oxidase copper chaperone protein [Xylona heveae TC161]KZF23730.1 cytochrome c oxidase copper chaperone protein [Xylona heveae TC161]